MSFHEVQFPPSISYGAVGGPRFLTNILTLASGYEKRNINWEVARAEYDVAHGLKTEAELAVLIKFFRARRGRAHGFRFKDWADYQVPFPGDATPTLFTTNGSTSTFQFTKIYSDSGGSYTRDILKPILTNMYMYNNGTIMTYGAGASQYQVDLTTGVVTLGATVAATTGRLITGTFEFDVPVRFDSDHLKASINDYNNYSWGQIPLVEDRL